jgi:anti-sigma regulatory factor (Ser/Thr protein kinase)
MSAQASQCDEVRGFHLRLPATPSSLAIFRDAVREWLLPLPLPPPDIFDIVLACSESLTLVVEERRRRVALVIEVTGDFDGDRVVVTVRDYGLWQETRQVEQHEHLSLSLMRALMDSVEHEQHHDGQTVTLVRRVGHGASGQNARLL